MRRDHVSSGRSVERAFLPQYLSKYRRTATGEQEEEHQHEARDGKVTISAVLRTIQACPKTCHGVGHVFMGTRGLGGVRGLLLGSVATQLLHLVDVPVTLVK